MKLEYILVPESVLILVLVEDGLGAKLKQYKYATSNVLILVLVEDGLGELTLLPLHTLLGSVLILVLVEDGLGESDNTANATIDDSLNPCFSGGWSRSLTELIDANKGITVLILVLVEDGLGEYDETRIYISSG